MHLKIHWKLKTQNSKFDSVPLARVALTAIFPANAAVTPAVANFP